MRMLLEAGNTNMPEGSDSLNIWQVRFHSLAATHISTSGYLHHPILNIVLLETDRSLYYHSAYV